MFAPFLSIHSHQTDMGWPDRELHQGRPWQVWQVRDEQWEWGAGWPSDGWCPQGFFFQLNFLSISTPLVFYGNSCCGLMVNWSAHNWVICSRLWVQPSYVAVFIRTWTRPSAVRSVFICTTTLGISPKTVDFYLDLLRHFWILGQFLSAPVSGIWVNFQGFSRNTNLLKWKFNRHLSDVTCHGYSLTPMALYQLRAIVTYIISKVRVLQVPSGPGPLRRTLNESEIRDVCGIHFHHRQKLGPTAFEAVGAAVDSNYPCDCNWIIKNHHVVQQLFVVLHWLCRKILLRRYYGSIMEALILLSYWVTSCKNLEKFRMLAGLWVELEHVWY